jgi:hypothetical protein
MEFQPEATKSRYGNVRRFHSNPCKPALTQGLLIVGYLNRPSSIT